jgi:hypothetical protein
MHPSIGYHTDTHVIFGFDPASRTCVTMFDTGQPYQLSRFHRVRHGDLADEVKRMLAGVAERFDERNWLYAVPAVKWPRFHRHGGEWLEIMSGIRFFVNHRRPAGSGDYIFQVRKQAMRELHRKDEEMPEEYRPAYRLAEALRWQYLLEPESIFG